MQLQYDHKDGCAYFVVYPKQSRRSSYALTFLHFDYIALKNEIVNATRVTIIWCII